MIIAFGIGNKKFSKVPTLDVDKGKEVMNTVAELGGLPQYELSVPYKHVDIWLGKHLGKISVNYFVI
ncbi:conserved hypothetical protein [Ricinus communis]|uniref:Uncharacterized protein n=1 Tax=Ricinus communis TaxID=3988 RepID=B9SR81_RICCO|nr:conserved hypothetical protein [Ricinus communis]